MEKRGMEGGRGDEGEKRDAGGRGVKGEEGWSEGLIAVCHPVSLGCSHCVLIVWARGHALIVV